MPQSHSKCSLDPRELLKLFTTSEIMRWKDLCQKYQKELQDVAPGNQVFNPKAEDGIKRWKDLKARVVEHVSQRSTRGFMQNKIIASHTRFGEHMDVNC